MTPNMYILILTKIGLFATLTAVVGISCWKILEKSKKRIISTLVGYYLVVMLVVLWFMGLGGIVVLG